MRCISNVADLKPLMQLYLKLEESVCIVSVQSNKLSRHRLALHQDSPKVLDMKHLGLLIATICLLPLATFSMSIETQSQEERILASDAIGTAELVMQRSMRIDGKLMTRFTFRTLDTLRGTIPSYFDAYAPGGLEGDTFLADSRLPDLIDGNSYLLFLIVQNDQIRFLNGPSGALTPSAVDLEQLEAAIGQLPEGTDLSAHAREPISVSAVALNESGLLDTNGFRRFTLADQNRPIPVYADVSTRPSGITEAEAIIALQNALGAWEAETSIRFEYIGTEIFPQSVRDYTSADGLVIRVQFHDNFNDITNGSSTLGIGGASYGTNLGDGGTIDGNAYNPVRFGYVVLEDSKATLEDPVSLEEVLTHEIGHVIGLAHSSETPGESDSTLNESIMYYTAHADGRGAALTTYDIDTALQSYPFNTPPFGYDRYLIATTIPGTWTLTNPEVNQVTISGYDLQGDSLTFIVDSSTTFHGNFSTTDFEVTFTLDGYYTEGDVADPLTGYRDRLVGRLSDGTNLSPFIDVRVVGFRQDTEPNGSPDGIPDSWMTTYYGSATGSTDSADTDGDGFTTLEEYLLGTAPTDNASAFGIIAYTGDSLEWTSQQFGTYTLESSLDLTTWNPARHYNQLDTATSISITDLPEPESGNQIFYRIQRQ